MSQVLSIVIPVYNEAATIHVILDKVLEVPLQYALERELVIVDDCSSDGTEARIAAYIAAHPQTQIRFSRHERNQGKGAAVCTGFALAGGDIVLIQDADMEYDPYDYNDLLKPMMEREADVVYGSRFIGSKPHRVLFFWHFMGNKLITTLCNLVANLNLTDVECCYKVFRKDVLNQISLREPRFGIEPEITIRIARIRGIRIYEVGVAYYGRTYSEGKKIRPKDGFYALWCIIKYGFFSK